MMKLTLLNVGAIVGALLTIGTAVAAIRPVLESDDPPLASAKRVNDLSNQVAQTLGSVQKGQDRFNARLGADELQINSMRRSAVLRDISDVSDLLKKQPRNAALQEDLDRDNQDLRDLLIEHDTLRKRLRGY